MFGLQCCGSSEQLYTCKTFWSMDLLPLLYELLQKLNFDQHEFLQELNFDQHGLQELMLT